MKSRRWVSFFADVISLFIFFTVIFLSIVGILCAAGPDLVITSGRPTVTLYNVVAGGCATVSGFTVKRA